MFVIFLRNLFFKQKGFQESQQSKQPLKTPLYMLFLWEWSLIFCSPCKINCSHMSTNQTNWQMTLNVDYLFLFLSLPTCYLPTHFIYLSLYLSVCAPIIYLYMYDRFYPWQILIWIISFFPLLPSLPISCFLFLLLPSLFGSFLFSFLLPSFPFFFSVSFLL